jgi:hypothetical protein
VAGKHLLVPFVVVILNGLDNASGRSVALTLQVVNTCSDICCDMVENKNLAIAHNSKFHPFVNFKIQKTRQIPRFSFRNF